MSGHLPLNVAVWRSLVVLAFVEITGKSFIGMNRYNRGWEQTFKRQDEQQLSENFCIQR